MVAILWLFGKSMRVKANTVTMMNNEDSAWAPRTLWGFWTKTSNHLALDFLFSLRKNILVHFLLLTANAFLTSNPYMAPCALRIRSTLLHMINKAPRDLAPTYLPRSASPTFAFAFRSWWSTATSVALSVPRRLMPPSFMLTGYDKHCLPHLRIPQK